MQLQSDSCPMEPMAIIMHNMATVGNTIQTVNSPIYEYMSAPGNATKLGTALSNIQTAQNFASLVGIEPTML